ncbi:hypothetical protein [Tunturiibacter gelidoferens]|uniref:DsDNA-specific endonuclease/ATPase MutS2 n=1 Tax=Tunturiibacter gelidiferens TaxID=3069689 RepID=A0A9X0U4H7_9BACT|nr:hypothetical protein [Edaphobacter lichenicola]MBB5329409.1 dsDNA-specific endonuclease/ATPase MutS2 [Edaphobacter lichenicola]
MEDLKKELQSLRELLDQGLESLEITMAQAFVRQEAQAKEHFEERVAEIDEMTSAATQRHERMMKAMDAIEDRASSAPRTVH